MNISIVSISSSPIDKVQTNITWAQEYEEARKCKYIFIPSNELVVVSVHSIKLLVRLLEILDVRHNNFRYSIHVTLFVYQ